MSTDRSIWRSFYKIGYWALISLALAVFVFSIKRTRKTEKTKGISSEKSDKIILITPYSSALRTLIAHQIKENYIKQYNKNLEIDFKDLGSMPETFARIKEILEKKGQLAEEDTLILGGGESVYNTNRSMLYPLPQKSLVGNDTPEEKALIEKIHFLKKGQFDLLREEFSGKEIRIPEEVVPIQEDANYIGHALYRLCILYNNTALASLGNMQVPRSTKEMAVNQQLMGQQASVNPRKSTVGFRDFELFNQYGWKEGYELLAQKYILSEIKSGASDAVDAVVKGDVVLTPTVYFYAEEARGLSPNLSIQALDIETGVDPMAILKEAKTTKPVVALRVMHIILSDDFQLFFHKKLKRIPVNAKAIQALYSEDLKAYGQLLAFYEKRQEKRSAATEVSDKMPVGWEKRDRAAMVRIIDAALLEPLIIGKLKKLFRKTQSIEDQKVRSQLIKELIAPPFDYESLQKNYLSTYRSTESKSGWEESIAQEKVRSHIQNIVLNNLNRCEKKIDQLTKDQPFLLKNKNGPR